MLHFHCFILSNLQWHSICLRNYNLFTFAHFLNPLNRFQHYCSTIEFPCVGSRPSAHQRRRVTWGFLQHLHPPLNAVRTEVWWRQCTGVPAIFGYYSRCLNLKSGKGNWSGWTRANGDEWSLQTWSPQIPIVLAVAKRWPIILIKATIHTL